MKSDVLVIGSSAAGLVASTTAKRCYPDKTVVVVSRQPKTLVPCGIPYLFGALAKTDNDIMPVDKMFAGLGIELITGEVKTVDRAARKVTLDDGKTIGYERLVLGTGSLPRQATFITGAGLKNVFYVPKDKVYLDGVLQQLENCKKIAVIGAGFIGVEVADELAQNHKQVTLIERLPTILPLAFDADVANRVEQLLAERGVIVRTAVEVEHIGGTSAVEGVFLRDGSKIEADAVIMAVGYRPEVQLAQDAGLPISPLGFIRVDEYMRTEDPHVFAIGDCAEKRDFVTRKPVMTMLASTACAEARIAGMNLFGLSAIKTFNGTISIFSTAIGPTGIGIAGLTEKIAAEENFNYVTGAFEGIDHHPGTLAGTHKQYVKLVVGKESGVILGGEVYGGLSVGELINTIGIIIQSRMTVNGLLTAQLGTHPLLTASPAGYPLVKAAEDAAIKMR